MQLFQQGGSFWLTHKPAGTQSARDLQLCSLRTDRGILSCRLRHKQLGPMYTVSPAAPGFAAGGARQAQPGSAQVYDFLGKQTAGQVSGQCSSAAGLWVANR